MSQESFDDIPTPLTNPKIRINVDLPIANEIRPVLEKRMSHFSHKDEEYNFSEVYDRKAEKVLNKITKRKMDLLDNIVT